MKMYNFLLKMGDFPTSHLSFQWGCIDHGDHAIRQEVPEVVQVPLNVPRMEELLLTWLMDPKVGFEHLILVCQKKSIGPKVWTKKVKDRRVGPVSGPRAKSRWWQLKHFWNFHPENWGFHDPI